MELPPIVGYRIYAKTPGVSDGLEITDGLQVLPSQNSSATGHLRYDYITPEFNGDIDALLDSNHSQTFYITFRSLADPNKTKLYVLLFQSPDALKADILKIWNSLDSGLTDEEKIGPVSAWLNMQGISLETLTQLFPDRKALLEKFYVTNTPASGNPTPEQLTRATILQNALQDQLDTVQALITKIGTPKTGQSQKLLSDILVIQVQLKKLYTDVAGVQKIGKKALAENLTQKKLSDLNSDSQKVLDTVQSEIKTLTPQITQLTLDVPKQIQLDLFRFESGTAYADGSVSRFSFASEALTSPKSGESYHDYRSRAQQDLKNVTVTMNIIDTQGKVIFSYPGRISLNMDGENVPHTFTLENGKYTAQYDYSFGVTRIPGGLDDRKPYSMVLAVDYKTPTGVAHAKRSAKLEVVTPEPVGEFSPPPVILPTDHTDTFTPPTLVAGTNSITITGGSVEDADNTAHNYTPVITYEARKGKQVFDINDLAPNTHYDIYAKYPTYDGKTNTLTQKVKPAGSVTTLPAIDTTAPVITLNGPSTIHFTSTSNAIVGTIGSYTEYGATWTDADANGVVTTGSDVVITGAEAIDPTQYNQAYTVTYTKTDAAGNIGTSTRTVTTCDPDNDPSCA